MRAAESQSGKKQREAVQAAGTRVLARREAGEEYTRKQSTLSASATDLHQTGNGSAATSLESSYLVLRPPASLRTILPFGLQELHEALRNVASSLRVPLPMRYSAPLDLRVFPP